MSIVADTFIILNILKFFETAPDTLNETLPFFAVAILGGKKIAGK